MPCSPVDLPGRELSGAVARQAGDLLRQQLGQRLLQLRVPVVRMRGVAVVAPHHPATFSPVVRVPAARAVTAVPLAPAAQDVTVAVLEPDFVLCIVWKVFRGSSVGAYARPQHHFPQGPENMIFNSIQLLR